MAPAAASDAYPGGDGLLAVDAPAAPDITGEQAGGWKTWPDRRTGWAARTAYLQGGSSYLIPTYVARLVVELSYSFSVLQTGLCARPLRSAGTPVVVLVFRP